MRNSENVEPVQVALNRTTLNRRALCRCLKPYLQHFDYLPKSAVDGIFRRSFVAVYEQHLAAVANENSIGKSEQDYGRHD